MPLLTKAAYLCLIFINTDTLSTSPRQRPSSTKSLASYSCGVSLFSLTDIICSSSECRCCRPLLATAASASANESLLPGLTSLLKHPDESLNIRETHKFAPECDEADFRRAHLCVFVAHPKYTLNYWLHLFILFIYYKDQNHLTPRCRYSW